MPHPLDAEAEDLPPAPVLLVATSDGKLRFYAAGHLRRPMQGVVRPPAPLPPAPALVQPTPSEAEKAPASAAGSSRPASADEDWVRVEQAAAVTALPSDADDEDDEGLEDKAPRPAPEAVPQGGNPGPADEQLQKAAAAGLPSSSDDEADSEPASGSDDEYDATSSPAAGRMQMPPAQSAPQPAVESTAGGATGATDGSKSLFAHRLSPAGAAAAARHAASSQPAVSGGGAVFGGAFSFAAPVGQTSGGGKDGPGFSLSGAFGGPQPSAFGMPAFGQSAPVRPLFGAPPAATKAPAAPPPMSAAAPAAEPSSKVHLRL